MKRIVASNNIYYIFKSSPKNGKKRHYEDIFVPKFFLNLYKLSKKKKILKNENKKHEDKDYLLNINSYFKQEQNGNINTFNVNNGYKSVQNKNTKNNNKRFLSANIKGLPVIRYTINDILNGNYKNNLRIESLKSVKQNSINNEIKSKKNILFIKKVKEKNNNVKTIKNIRKIKINEYNGSKNNSADNSVNEQFEEKNYESIKVKNSIKSRNIYDIHSQINEKKLNSEAASLKNISIFNRGMFQFNNKNKFNNKNQSIIKTKINRKFNFLRSQEKEREISKNSDNSKSKSIKKSLKNIKGENQPLKIKNSYLLMDNYCIFTGKKVAPKLPPLMKVNDFKIKYESKEDILPLFSDKRIEYVLINNNILLPNEKYYFYINKRYRYQLINYMKHRINWEYSDINNTNNNDNNIIINFEWKYYSNKVNFKKFKYEQNTPIKKLKMINLFEKNYEIGNKKNMFINLITFCEQIGYNIFDVVPFTLILSNTKDIEYSFNALKELMDFIQKNKNITTNIITNRKYNDHFWYDKNYEFINKQYINFNKNFISDKNYWIIKPPDLYQGKCIEICNNFDDIQKKCKKMFKGVDKTNIPELEYEEYSNGEDELDDCNQGKKPTKFYCCNDIIIQKYLDNPLLYQKRKFDIRCFVLIDSNLNVYFCKEGHLKGCSEFYNLNETNKFIHITNYSFQKNSSNFEKFEIGNEISYKDFKKFLLNERIPIEKFDEMINQMKFLIKLSFKAVSNKLMKINPVLCFEIFGYDFILDNDFKPWILEINDNPGLCISSPVIEKLVPRMMDDAFRLTIDKVFNTKYAPGCFDEKGNYKSKFRLDGFNDNENIFEFLCNLNEVL